MSTAQAGAGSGQVYALLADGTTVEIRPAGPEDFGAVKAMHEALSLDNTYLRFFSLSQVAAGTEARRICRDPSPDQVGCSRCRTAKWPAAPAMPPSASQDRAAAAA